MSTDSIPAKLGGFSSAWSRLVPETSTTFVSSLPAASTARTMTKRVALLGSPPRTAEVAPGSVSTMAQGPLGETPAPFCPIVARLAIPPGCLLIRQPILAPFWTAVAFLLLTATAWGHHLWQQHRRKKQIESPL